MKQQLWWSPKGSDDQEPSTGTLLSHRWVQTFVFELPPLKPKELETTLRFKVQATLPVNIDDFAFHTQLFRHGSQICGAAFLASEIAKDALPASAGTLRVGVPLALPKGFVPKVLLFISTPEGLVPHYYEEGILKTSFAPIDPDDMELRERVLSKCPDAEIIGLAPDSRFPLPSGLDEKEPAEPLRVKLLDAFPSWVARPPRRYPQIIGSLLLAAGLMLCILALWNSWSVREQRNKVWKEWLQKTESVKVAPSLQEQAAKVLKAQGAPVPDLFAHLSRVWGNQTRIIDLEWAQGKLTLTAVSPAALLSLQKLTSDPWFRNMHVDDIRTQKDGTEVFTAEGALSIDF